MTKLIFAAALALLSALAPAPVFSRNKRRSTPPYSTWGLCDNGTSPNLGGEKGNPSCGGHGGAGGGGGGGAYILESLLVKSRTVIPVIVGKGGMGGDWGDRGDAKMEAPGQPGTSGEDGTKSCVLDRCAEGGKGGEAGSGGVAGRQHQTPTTESKSGQGGAGGAQPPPRSSESETVAGGKGGDISSNRRNLSDVAYMLSASDIAHVGPSGGYAASFGSANNKVSVISENHGFIGLAGGGVEASKGNGGAGGGGGKGGGAGRPFCEQSQSGEFRWSSGDGPGIDGEYGGPAGDGADGQVVIYWVENSN